MNVNVTCGEVSVLHTRHSVSAIIRQSHVPCLHTSFKKKKLQE